MPAIAGTPGSAGNVTHDRVEIVLLVRIRSDVLGPELTRLLDLGPVVPMTLATAERLLRDAAGGPRDRELPASGRRIIETRSHRFDLNARRVTKRRSRRNIRLTPELWELLGILFDTRGQLTSAEIAERIGMITDSGVRKRFDALKVALGNVYDEIIGWRCGAGQIRGYWIRPSARLSDDE